MPTASVLTKLDVMVAALFDNILENKQDVIEEAVETLRMLKEIRTANCDFSRYQLRIEKAEKAPDTFLAMRADGEISKEFSYTYAYPENDGEPHWLFKL